MKTTSSIKWMTVCAAVLTATAAFRVSADPAAPPAMPEKSYTGTVVSVDPKENVLSVKGWFWHKGFNLGNDCAYTLLDNKGGTANDLRPGAKVTVSYQDANGVLIADRVEQRPMRDEGMVKAIDPKAHTLTLHLRGLDKTFQIANDCGIVLRDDKTGTLADIQPGNHVTVTYETPDGNLTARQIAQTSIGFTGTLTAIDLGEKTLKAKAGFISKKFNVADNCAIVINGRPDGQLNDLKPDDNLVISYDEINGINVVNRIAPADAQPNPVTARATPMGGS
jgi:Cu/Ag efflux protein CusF